MVHDASWTNESESVLLSYQIGCGVRVFVSILVCVKEYIVPNHAVQRKVPTGYRPQYALARIRLVSENGYTYEGYDLCIQWQERD